MTITVTFAFLYRLVVALVLTGLAIWTIGGSLTRRRGQPREWGDAAILLLVWLVLTTAIWAR